MHTKYENENCTWYISTLAGKGYVNFVGRQTDINQHVPDCLICKVAGGINKGEKKCIYGNP